MTSDDDARQKLSRVLDPLVDDILSLSDEEILAETQEGGGDPALLAAEVGNELAAAMSAVGKKRLAEARAAINSVSTLRRHPSITTMSLPDKTRILQQFAANDRPLQNRLTMAARKGDGISEEEIDTVLLDLIELGALDDKGNVR